MFLKEKLKNFVAQLSDDEIDEQIENILEWAKIYKDLLQDEKQRRQRHLSSHFPVEQTYKIDCAREYEETVEELGFDADFDLSETIDYNLAQIIQQKTARLSIEETEKRLDKLKSISDTDLSDIEKTQLLYEIETCELHLYELTGVSEDVDCPSCGANLEDGAKFCSNCGLKLIL